jgi:uncharacterized protein (TIGR02996 family)
MTIEIVKPVSGVLDGPNAPEYRLVQASLRFLGLLYAVYLEECGATRWFEIHRVQCELDGLPPEDRKRRQLLHPRGEDDILTQEGALLLAILANPQDLAVRLVYADWLEERGDSVRAEYFRVECELDALPRKRRKRRQLLTRRLTDVCLQCSPTPSVLFRDCLFSWALKLRRSPKWTRGYAELDFSPEVVRRIGTVALVLARPNWTLRQYAQILQCSPSTLYRNSLLGARCLRWDSCRNSRLLEAWSLIGDSFPQ